MTGFEDDVADGAGRVPTKLQIIAVRNYLKSHNRDFSIRKTRDELLARNFKANLSAVQRSLKGVEGGIPPHPKGATKAERRAIDRRGQDRYLAKKRRAPAPPPPLETVTIVMAETDAPETATPERPSRTPEPEVKLSTLVELLVEANSSTQLAIRENRMRMALNIILLEQMAAKPAMLLLDMTGTARLIDALTIATKLSGGASIDVVVPIRGDQPVANSNGHDMVDVTPSSQLVTSIEKWRREQKNGA